MIEYLEGWLAGRGAKGIDSLEGRPGIHPRLMEDLATARISVAQTAQRILHAAADSDSGEVHDFQLVKGLVQQELADILRLRDEAGQDAAARARYTKAGVITVHWIKSYTELNFRSLGSYTRADLDAIAAAPEAF
jgi:malate synthase